MNSKRSLFFIGFVAAACSPEPQRQTDVRRKIKDSWVDWDDHIQAWQRLNVEGQNIIATIANTKLTAVYVNIYCCTILCFMVFLCIHLYNTYVLCNVYILSLLLTRGYSARFQV